MNSSSKGQSTKPINWAQCSRRLSSSTAAPTSAVTSRFQSVNRNTAMSTPATTMSAASKPMRESGNAATRRVTSV